MFARLNVSQIRLELSQVHNFPANRASTAYTQCRLFLFHWCYVWIFFFFFTKMPEVCKTLKEIVIMSSVDSGWRVLKIAMKKPNQSYALWEQRMKSKALALFLVPHFSLCLPRLSFIAWGNFNAGSRSAALCYPWGKMSGTTRSLKKQQLD